MAASLYFSQAFEAAAFSDPIDFEQIQETERKTYVILLLFLYTVIIWFVKIANIASRYVILQMRV